MADHKINITISGGSLQYEQIKDGVSMGDGRHAHVRTTDNIRWHCDAGDFAVLFKRNALDTGVLSAQAGRDTQTAHIRAAHNGNNTYPYFVVVIAQANGVPVFEDPDIIIDI